MPAFRIPSWLQPTRLMQKLLVFIVLLAVAACNQGAKEKNQTRAEVPRPKALLAERVEGVSPFQVMLGLEPGEPRSEQQTTFRFAVRENHQPVRDAAVHVSLVMPLMDMGKNEFDASETATPGLYEAGGKFTMGDEWEIFVTVAKDGKKGVHVFNVRVQE